MRPYDYFDHLFLYVTSLEHFRVVNLVVQVQVLLLYALLFYNRV